MMKHFDKETIHSADKSFRRNFINCLSGYKSLNLIGTKSTAGITNLAPFSQVFHIGASPPLVGILFRPNTVDRHTLDNILATQVFTLNHVTESFYKAAHHASARWQQSEFEATGIAEEYMDGFFAPFVKESPLKVGCTLSEVQTLQINGTIMVIGEIAHVYVEESAVGADGFISLDVLGTVTVSGLDAYHVGQKLGRLSYAKPHEPPREI
jgi:flavin reductase (DIM6/NTAB) family NADH-FMN oxidoreductase RutF